MASSHVALARWRAEKGSWGAISPRGDYQTLRQARKPNSMFTARSADLHVSEKGGIYSGCLGRDMEIYLQLHINPKIHL